MALPTVTITGIMPRLMTWKPLTFLAVAIAGWMNRRQQEASNYRKEENRILRENLGYIQAEIRREKECV
jgi:hypothetical protein